MADWAKAQRLMDRQLKTNWLRMLNQVARQLNPIHEQIFARWKPVYYWSTYQSEWAIDVVFRQAETLRRLYPRLIHHGLSTFASPDEMRFLGRQMPLSGNVNQRFRGEVRSDLKRRQEGVRIKHYVNGNSLKLYDKAFTTVGSVLRAEMTLQQEGDFRVYRCLESDPQGKPAWRVMRRGVADLHRRAEVSHQATERYLDALATVDDDTTLEELIRRLGQSRQWKGRRVRALHPLTEDRKLLEAISRGEFMVNGLRNLDLQKIFFSHEYTTRQEKRRKSAWVSRKLRMLRAHGLLRKVPGTHRYHLTDSGRKITTAILTALRSTIREMTPAAA